MGFNDGSTDIQTHAHTITFGAEEGLKHAFYH
jgi:hypothetical protein